MANANITTDGERWLVEPQEITVTGTSTSGKSVTLHTAGTFLDRDIVVEAPVARVASAKATVSAATEIKPSGLIVTSGNVDIAGSATTVRPDEGYFVEATPSTPTRTNITYNTNITAEGYLDKTSQISTSGTIAGGRGETYFIPLTSASVEISGEAQASGLSLTVEDSNVATKEVTSVRPTNGYYIVTTVDSPSTEIALTPEIKNAGWVGSNGDEINAHATLTAKSAVKYIPIQSGNILNSAADPGEDYVEDFTAVPSEGWLTLTAGYYPNTKISLDTILDGKEDEAGISDSEIRNGKVVYTVDGKKLTGTMGEAVVKSGVVSQIIAAPVYNEETGRFDQNSSTTIKKPNIAVDGYISQSSITEEDKTVVENYPLAKIAGSIVVDGETTVTPTIDARQFSIDGVTNAAGGKATTVAPTEGVYVQVKSSASTETVVATTNITTAGYGTADNNDISNAEFTVGVESSADTYIPIATTTVTSGESYVEATSNSVSLGEGLEEAPEKGAYIAVVGGGTLSIDKAGWIESGIFSSNEKTVYYPITVSGEQAEAIVGKGSVEFTDLQVSDLGTKNFQFGDYNEENDTVSLSTSVSTALTPVITTTKGYIEDGVLNGAPFTKDLSTTFDINAYNGTYDLK